MPYFCRDNIKHFISSMKNIKKDKVLSFLSHNDSRGSLTCIDEIKIQIPFETERIFWIYDVEKNAVRGEHAHRTCEEVIIAVNGHVEVELTDSNGKFTFNLDNPNKGLYIPTMCWCRFTNFSDGCVLLCLASEKYNAGGYINNYKEFLREINAND